MTGVTVPLSLVTLAAVDGAFAGFRAGTGRNARIRKHRYNLVAAGRGLAVSAVGLALTGVVLAAGAHDYDDLVAAGARMLTVLVPYAVLVMTMLAAYWLLPMRMSTLVILVGLGPFTLLRPVVVLASVVAAAYGTGDWLTWTGGAVAATGVLLVEPWVHRRWYPSPL